MHVEDEDPHPLGMTKKGRIALRKVGRFVSTPSTLPCSATVAQEGRGSLRPADASCSCLFPSPLFHCFPLFAVRR